jgi:cell division protein FtsL
MTLAQPRQAPRPDLEVIPGSAPRRRTKISHWVIFAIAVVFAFFGLIYSRISLDNSAFELQKLDDQITAQEQLGTQLSAQLAELQNPETLNQQIAQLGMVYPDDRVGLKVPVVSVEDLDPDYRWAQLKSILSAQP